MAGPITGFSADECQALLDLIDVLGVDLYGSHWTGNALDLSGLDEEQSAAYSKLREAGKFYLPETAKSPHSEE